MEKWFFDIESGDTAYTISDSEAVSEKGDYLLRMDDDCVLNTETNEFEIISGWPNERDPFDDNGDDDMF